MAAKSLEELLRINPGDRKTLAQLVVAYAQVSINIPKARRSERYASHDSPDMFTPLYLITSETIQTCILGINVCLIFLYAVVLSIFHPIKYLPSYNRDAHRNVSRSSYKVSIIAQF